MNSNEYVRHPLLVGISFPFTNFPVSIKCMIVSSVPGRGNAMEVLVQGKQIKAVTDFLIAQGVPKKWIEAIDLSKKEK